jgi:hypothetical protein
VEGTDEEDMKFHNKLS